MPTPLDLRSTAAQGASATSVVGRFLEDFSAGQFRRAARHLRDDFVWLGVSMTPEVWAARATSAYADSVPMPTQVVERLDWSILQNVPVDTALAAFDGPLREGVTAFLVDITRGATTVTLGLLVCDTDTKGPAIERAFDPGRWPELFGADADAKT